MIDKLMERFQFELLENDDYLVYKRRDSNDTIVLPKDNHLTSRNLEFVMSQQPMIEITGL